MISISGYSLLSQPMSSSSLPPIQLCAAWLYWIQSAPLISWILVLRIFQLFWIMNCSPEPHWLCSIEQTSHNPPFFTINLSINQFFFWILTFHISNWRWREVLVQFKYHRFLRPLQNDALSCLKSSKLLANWFDRNWDCLCLIFKPTQLILNVAKLVVSKERGTFENSSEKTQWRKVENNCKALQNLLSQRRERGTFENSFEKPKKITNRCKTCCQRGEKPVPDVHCARCLFFGPLSYPPSQSSDWLKVDSNAKLNGSSMFEWMTIYHWQ